MNSASRAWGIRDFIKSFAETGKKDYQELLNFMEEHELSPTNSAHLLYGNAGTSGTHGGSISTVVKEGRFKVNEPKKAAVIAQQLRALQKYSEFKTTSDRDLLRALWLLLDEADFDFEVFLYKLDKHEQRLVKKNSTKYYLLEIEDVYNYSTTAENKVNLYKGQV